MGLAAALACLALLVGCAVQKPAVKSEPDLDPRHVVASHPLSISSVASHQTESVDNKAPDTLAVVLPETITASWRNNNTGNPDVVTSLQSTTDLTSGNWATLWETNCDDEITIAVIPRPQVPTTFYRNGNRLIE